MYISVSAVYVQRILFELRNVEQAVKLCANHDASVGIHEVAERLAILRLVLTKAFEESN